MSLATLSSQVLVQKVIDHFRLHPEALGNTPMPLAPDILEMLTFSNGKPLPPSLKLWLAFDAKSLGLFTDLDHLVTTPRSISEEAGPAFNTMQRMMLPDASYILYPGSGDTSWFFLYTGQTDDEGEYPIFVGDIDDQYFVKLFAPNFAIWLADRHGILDSDQPEYAALMQKQSDLNFHGYHYCEIYGEAVSMDGTPTKWCSEDDLIVDFRKQGFDDQTINEILNKDHPDSMIL
jgi:hypothetical protein